MISFYNTINLEGIELFNAEATAQTQEQKILRFFKNNQGLKMSPSEIHRILTRGSVIHPATPVTSVRRALTNLTNKNLLVMLEEMKAGPLGKPEHLWIGTLFN